MISLRDASPVLLLIAFAMVLPAGCGRDETETPDERGGPDGAPVEHALGDAPAEDEDGAKETDSPESQPPAGDAAPADTAEAPQGDGTPPTDGEPTGPDAAEDEGARLELRLRARREQILELIRLGEFTEASAELREVVAEYPRYRQRLQFSPLLNETTRHQRGEGSVRFAMQKLGGYSERELRITRRKLERAGETGVLVLTKAIRTADDATAEAAIRLLRDVNPSALPNACAQRLLHKPESELRKPCIEVLRSNGDDLSALGARHLFQAAVSHAELPDSLSMRRLAAARIAQGIEAQALQSLLVRVRGLPADDQSRGELLRFLAAVYHFSAQRSDDAFAEQSGGLQTAEAARAATAHLPDGPVREQITQLLMPLSVQALEKGLLGRWTFGTAKWPFLARDTDTLHLRTKGYSVKRETSDDALSGSYAVAAWVRPESLPTGQQPTPFWTLVRKSGWPMALLVDSEGHPVFMQFVEGADRPITCRGASRLAPGRWTHLALSVDTQQGTVTLFADAQHAGSTEFPRDSTLANKPDPSRPFRVLDLPAGDIEQVRFPGDVDDLRLYGRPVTPNEVRDLRSLGFAWQ